MKTLRINVKDKIATFFQRDGVIVCGNKGYKLVFTFDEEWADCTTKTARFIWNGHYYDKQFTDNECEVPVLNDTTKVTVGVYAGDLKTTTPAEIPCLISIICGNPEYIEENIKEYRDIAQQSAEEAQQAAREAKQAATAVVHPTIDVEEIEGGHRLTINDADGEKAFDVMDGEGSGEQGLDGEDGATFTPSVSSDGILSWTNNKGLPNPDSVNIKGTPGVDGKDGKDGRNGIDGKDGYTPIKGVDYFDGTNGKDGVDGKDGQLTEDQLALLNKLSGWYDEEHYTQMTGSFTATTSGGTFEIGSVITSTFTWSFSKLPTTLTVGGTSKTPTKTGTTASQTFTASSQTSKSFTITGVYAGAYGNETVTKTWTYTFQNKLYYGAKAEPSKIDSAFITSLSKSAYATNYKNTGFNLNDASEDKYIWYIFPERFESSKAPTFTMGGFEGGFKKIGTVDFTNYSAFTEKYSVYRSINAGVCDLSITVS